MSQQHWLPWAAGLGALLIAALAFAAWGTAGAGIAFDMLVAFCA